MERGAAKAEQPCQTPVADELSAGNSNQAVRIEKNRKNLIFISAKEVGVDLMTATGGAVISEEDITALYDSGYFEYSIDDILNSYFDDWHDFNRLVQDSYRDREAQRLEHRRQLLTEIRSSILPSDLFKTVEYVADAELSVTRKRRDGTEHRLEDIGIIKDVEVDEDERITRYCRYVLAKSLFGEARLNIDDERVLGIVLGISLHSKNTVPGDAEPGVKKGKKITSFQSEMRKVSNDAITQADVEMKAESAGYYDYIYPDRREKYLNGLRAAVGFLPERGSSSLPKNPDIYYDLGNGRILIGSLAVDSYLRDSGGYTAELYELGELLVSDVPLPNFSEPHQTRKWTNEDMVVYGKWLMGMSLRHDKSLQESVLRRAFRLGLGPSHATLAQESRFSSLANYYQEVGVLGRTHYKVYDDWKLDDYVVHIKKVWKEIKKRPTRSILSQRIKDGRNEPSPAVMDKVGGLSVILEEAGKKPYNRRLDQAQCIKAGVKFYMQYGRLPRASDIDRRDDLPSRFPINKYCGGVRSYQGLILESLEIKRTAA